MPSSTSRNPAGDILPSAETLTRPAIYVAKKGEPFEFKVLGYDLRVLHFRSISKDERKKWRVPIRTAYVMTYEYMQEFDFGVKRRPGYFQHTAIFLGEKPEIFFLYDHQTDKRRAIEEHEVCIDQKGNAFLELRVKDAANDPERH
jgi:hypothetical protein